MDNGETPRSLHAPATGGVLIVDDNRSNLIAVEAALRDIGERLVTASSGREALRHLLRDEFAMVFLDVQMPSMDGLETARIIRSRERTRDLPIVFITGFDTCESEILAAYELGAVDFLFKPIHPQVLRAKASVFVALQRRTAEVARQAALLREHEADEHERKLVEERRRWEAEELRRRDRQKDEFLAVLAHELRNPLTPLVTGFEILRRHPNVDDVVARVRDAADRQLLHLQRLVDDLLDISRITSGKIELRCELIDLRQVVREAVTSCTDAIRHRGQHLEIQIPEDELWVRGDPIRLVQIVCNLLNNSNRYTPAGGRIEVACGRRGDSHDVRVSDDGAGIPPALLDHIFDLFAQQSPSEGLGLGLTLVSRLIELHGGTVRAESEGGGRGSTFTVSLPAAPAPVEDGARGEREVAAPLASTDPVRLVLIEDDADVRRTLLDLLKMLGHRVTVAADGLEGLEALLREQPDVALIDIGLPKLDGYGVAERVRAAIPEGGPRLVAMSGRCQKADRERARSAGFHEYLVKPPTCESLMRAIHPT